MLEFTSSTSFFSSVVSFFLSFMSAISFFMYFFMFVLSVFMSFFKSVNVFFKFFFSSPVSLFRSATEACISAPSDLRSAGVDGSVELPGVGSAKDAKDARESFAFLPLELHWGGSTLPDVAACDVHRNGVGGDWRHVLLTFSYESLQMHGWRREVAGIHLAGLAKNGANEHGVSSAH
jgi:hypothetical protein